VSGSHARHSASLVELGVPLAGATWLGLLIGVSFIATPIKFAAQSLTLPVALEVGRVTFGLFNRVEWAMLFLLLASSWIARGSLLLRACAHALCLTLVAQTFWLLPILDERVGAIITGGQITGSYHHWVYIAADVAKLLLLIAVIWTSSCRLLKRRDTASAQASPGSAQALVIQ
jgi:hypothetical protein